MPIELDEFQKGVEPSKVQREAKQYREKITEFLSSNPKNAYTMKEIADAIGEEVRPVRNILMNMHEKGTVGRKTCEVSGENGKTVARIHFAWINEKA